MRAKSMTLILLILLLVVGQGQADNPLSLLESSGVKGGIVVHLGCGDGQATVSLRAADSHVVRGLDNDAEDVEKARRHVRSLGKYGPVSIGHLTGPRLPFADGLVNLLIASELCGIERDECRRVLAPGGIAYFREDGDWEKTVKPWPSTIDEWTHHLHDASGNAVGNDTRVAPPQHMQWTAGPPWARSHGWTPTVTAMVSSNGRLFYLCDETLNGADNTLPSKWFLVARDAFSGVLLWKRPVPNWGSRAMSGTPNYSGGGVSVGRFTMPPHAAKRLVAVDDTVYVTLGAHSPVSALDAATGEVKERYAETARADEILCTDGHLLVSINPPRSARPGVVDKNETPSSPPGKRLCCIDTSNGKLKWEAESFSGIRAGRSQDPFGRLELCAGDGKVFLLTTDAIHCRSLDTGKQLWQLDRPDLPADAVRKLGFSGMYEFRLSVMVYQDGVLLLAQPEPNTHHTYHTMPGTLHAFNAQDGEPLWKQRYGGWGHCTPPDVFVVGNRVWTHAHVPTEYGSVWGNGYRAKNPGQVDYHIQSFDLKTGELLQKLPTKDIFNVGHHHRCYRNKITERFLLASRRGVEFVDLRSGENLQNHWVRSGCKVGNLPCNGLLYVAPHPCGCYINAKLTGFNALASSRKTAHEKRFKRLQTGPAYGSVSGGEESSAKQSDWPMFRHDVLRSGATDVTVNADLETVWTQKVAPNPGGLIVAKGQVLVAGGDEHTVTALDADRGTCGWTYVTGARVQSPPTFYHGLAIFGSADGAVYCLRATDGELAWRFQAAPESRYVTAFNQLESAWPVPGVLVQDDTCWFAAGRSSYLDAGIRVYALNPRTGEKVHDEVVYSPDPETGKIPPETSARHVKGLLNDIPGSDGTDVFIRQRCVSSDKKKKSNGHLYTTAGFLDSTWFNRTFWQIGRARTTGPMVLGDGVAYGIEPFTSRNRDKLIQPGSNPYRLRCLAVSDRAMPKSKRSGKTRKQRGNRNMLWEKRLGIRAGSLVRAGDTLLVAGVPDVVDPQDPHAAFEGRKGGVLAGFSTTDGAPQAEVKLPARPVWDGMAVAGNRVYLALEDGTVMCLQ